MNKKDFLDKLRKKLSILNDEEIEDIINEYEGYIDEKLNEGKTEKEAVKELGNVNEIANDLLEAYKVKPTVNDEENFVDKIIKAITNFIEIIINSLKGKSLADIIRMLILLCLIVLVIWAFKLPFIAIEHIGVGILDHFNNGFVRFISKLWVTIIEFSYFVIAIIALITIVKKEFLKRGYINEEQPIKKTSKINKEVKKDSIEKVVVKEKKGFIERLGDVLTKIVILFLKFICFWILLGILGYIVAISVAFACSIYVFIATFKFLGLVILLLGLLIIGINFAEIGFNFIVNRKNSWKRLFISIISCVVLFGAGCGFLSMSIANTKITRIPRTDKKEIVYNMNKDLFIHGLDFNNIIVDESEKNIKVVYKYNKDFVKIKKSTDEELRLDLYDYKVNNKFLFDFFINGLKKDKLYYIDDMVDYKIYANSENKKILEDNYSKWLEEVRKDETAELEDLEELGEINN